MGVREDGVLARLISPRPPTFLQVLFLNNNNLTGTLPLVRICWRLV